MKSQLEIAIDLATKYHHGQRYGKLPYIAHLMQVDDWVVERYGNLKVKTVEQSQKEYLDMLRAVAYCHDLFEDTECSPLMAYEAGLSDEVIGSVLLLTKATGHEYDYEEYISEILKVELAKEVKICDTMANLTQSVKKGNSKRIVKYAKQLSLLVGGWQ